MKVKKSDVALGVLAVVMIAVSLYCFAYMHTTKGANFGCWPESFPPMPPSIEVQYERYCGA